MINKLATTIVLATLSASATAATYTGSSPYAETHGITKFKMHSFSDRLAEATDEQIKFDIHSGGVLLPANSALSGLSNGVAQYGHVTGAYVQSDLRYDNVLNDLAFVADDPFAAALAVTEVKLKNELLQQEYKKNGVVFGSSYSMTNYYLICTDPVTTKDDLKGKRVRTGSSAQIQWAQHMGATSVSVPATEIYTGLQRGNVDCALGDASFLTSSFKLQEVAKHVTLISLGTHTSGGEFFNADFWEDRSEEERKILLSELARSIAELQVFWAQQAKDSLEEATSNNVELHHPSQSLQESLDTFKSKFVEGLPEAAVESRGVNSPSDIIDQYLESEKKWKKLLSGSDRGDIEQLSSLIEKELYAGIDLQNYGM